MHAFDFLTTVDRTESPDLIGGLTKITISQTELNNALPLNIPDDSTQTKDDYVRTNEGQQVFKVAGNVDDIQYVSGPTIDGVATGDSEKHITIRVHTPATGPATCEILLMWSAHLSVGDAPGIGWGVGQGAGSISGAPYHQTVDGFYDANGNGKMDGSESLGKGDVQIQAGAIRICPPGSLSITKTASPTTVTRPAMLSRHLHDHEHRDHNC